MKGRGLSIAVVAAFFVVCGLVIWLATGRKPSSEQNPAASASSQAQPAPSDKKPSGPAVEIVVSSSDGKKDWLEDVAKTFQASGAAVGGKPIKVSLIHMKSGESMQKILDGKEKPTIWSPAGGAWIDQINTTWKTRTGRAFVENPKPTVMSGLVIAMWEPMAQALGWPGKPIGWDEIFKVAADPKGWATYKHQEWGPFRFGHSHPDFSTSAMLSVISSIYAAAGKTAGVTPDDLKNQKVIDRVGALERSIVHYGESSSWMTEKLCTKGPAYLSAVTLYESSVVQANDKYKSQMPFKLVAIYPKEGTFWENHPSGIVQADWVTAEQKEAGEKFLAYMTDKEQQAKAPKYGYRPTDASVPLASPIDEAHGVNPKENASKSLEYPSQEVFSRAQELWHKVKKHSTVFLLLDVSGSMQEKGKITAAKKGAASFIRAMQKEDEIAVVAFSTNVSLLRPLAPVREVGEVLATQVEGLFADGQTAMYDAAIQAMSEIEKARKTAAGGQRLYGIVLLSDGKDTSSKKTLNDLKDLMKDTEGADGTRLFTVAYGDDADGDLLKQLADRSNARFLKGNTDNIDKVYHQISAYF
ncbi:MAG: VWA domain-containing protein [Deltaproteobacteria bacterium]|nr:VWA domain-containing protein [Deltaproteobacteria bacterium]